MQEPRARRHAIPEDSSDDDVRDDDKGANQEIRCAVEVGRKKHGGYDGGNAKLLAMDVSDAVGGEASKGKLQPSKVGEIAGGVVRDAGGSGEDGVRAAAMGAAKAAVGQGKSVEDALVAAGAAAKSMEGSTPDGVVRAVGGSARASV